MLLALPNTIDGVAERLESIARYGVAKRDRLGYYAALHHRVTLAVREGIAKGDFDDGPRMERLYVTFANRYLAAYHRHRGAERCSRVWMQAFGAARRPQYVVLQHLLLGMHAHINLDLGIAAARTCPGSELAGLRRDFDRLVTVLAALSPLIEQKLDNPALPHAAPNLNLRMVGFSMENARAAAWRFAEELAPLAPEAQAPHLDRRDGEVSLFGPGVLMKNGRFIQMIRTGESSDVSHNIRRLAQGEFRSTIPPIINLPDDPDP